jgi:hypothetical protein
LVLNLSLPCPFFSWTPSTNVYCSYKMFRSLVHSESQYFIPLFNKVSLLCRQTARRVWSIKLGVKLRPNTGPTRHDFTDR